MFKSTNDPTELLQRYASKYIYIKKCARIMTTINKSKHMHKTAGNQS